MKRFVWILAAAVAALAAFVSLQHETPVDRALPFLAAALTVVAAVSYSSIMAGVLLLIAAEVALPGEGMRLLAFGAVLAAAFGVAVGFPRRRAEEPGVEHSLVVAGLAILALRWIPAGEVLAWRELVLLAISLLIVVVLDGIPLSIAIAVIAALVTPAIPLRTLALPLLVLVAAVAARMFGFRPPRLAWPAAIAVALPMLFFAWSGVAAHALPYFLARNAPAVIPQPIRVALPPARSMQFEVPEGATALVVSGANVSHLRRGTPLGRVEPGGRVIRIGDASDWGALRRDQLYASHNPLPRDPAGHLRGYGITAWVDGAGRVPLPPGRRTIRVTADASLAPGAALQVEGFEIRTP